MTKQASNSDEDIDLSIFDDPIYENLVENQEAFKKQNGEVVVEVGFDYVRPLIDQYVSDICSSQALAWKSQIPTKGHARPDRLYLSRYSGLFNAFIECLLSDHKMAGYTPSLCSSILWEAMEALHFRHAHSDKPMAPSGVPRLLNWELENRLIEQVRLKAQGKGFKRSDYEQRRNCRRNYDSGVKFVEEIFGLYSRLQIARIDLYYQTQFKAELTLKQVQDDLQRLWGLRRTELYRDIWVGFMWSLEYTDQQRFHYHMILFFDGSEVKRPHYYAGLIGEHWKEVATGGRGYAHVCYPTEYKFPYLGEIEAIELDKRDLLLQEGVGYLTKCDQLLPINLEKVCTFGTSELPKKTSAAGRPRLPKEIRAPRGSKPLMTKRNDPYFENAGLWPQ